MSLILTQTKKRSLSDSKKTANNCGFYVFSYVFIYLVSTPKCQKQRTAQHSSKPACTACHCTALDVSCFREFIQQLWFLRSQASVSGAIHQKQVVKKKLVWYKITILVWKCERETSSCVRGERWKEARLFDWKGSFTTWWRWTRAQFLVANFGYCKSVGRLKRHKTLLRIHIHKTSKHHTLKITNIQTRK